MVGVGFAFTPECLVLKGFLRTQRLKWSEIERFEIFYGGLGVEMKDGSWKTSSVASESQINSMLDRQGTSSKNLAEGMNELLAAIQKDGFDRERLEKEFGLVLNDR